MTPSAKDLAEAGPSSCSSLPTQEKCVSPKDIWPIPNQKKKTTRKGPKPVKAAIITSSPYKLALEEAKIKNAEKEMKNHHTNGQGEANSKEKAKKATRKVKKNLSNENCNFLLKRQKKSS